MKLFLSISCVDGSSVFIETTSPKFARQFLDKHDHEGSSLFLRIEVEDAEKIHNLLGTNETN